MKIQQLLGQLKKSKDKVRFTAVRDVMESGKIPRLEEKTPSLSSTDLKALLTQLAGGELPTNGQVVIIAHNLGVETVIEQT